MTIPDADRLLELIVRYGAARLHTGFRSGTTLLTGLSESDHEDLTAFDQESVETMREIVSIVYRLYRERGDG